MIRLNHDERWLIEIPDHETSGPASDVIRNKKKKMEGCLMGFTILVTFFVLAVLIVGLFFVIQGINQKNLRKVAIVIVLLVLFVVIMYLVLARINGAM